MTSSKLKNTKLKNLELKDLKPNPFEEFQIWFKKAHDEIETYPEHMMLSTLDAQGFPQSRVVLLRGFKPPYFQFFTNYTSQKAQDLKGHNKAGLLFYWKELGRQIRILGEVSFCNKEDSDAYWSTRPRESQIHAWASKQSHPLTSFSELEERVAEFREKFKDQIIPRPEHWGGYQLEAQSFEFWQEGPFRLHRRFVYTPKDKQTWEIQALNP